MEIHVILIAVCALILPVFTEIRYNGRVRGPPLPPRPPHPPQFAKKWPMPPRQPPNRNFVRPIPVHMASYKQQVVVPRPPNFPGNFPPKYPAPAIFPSAIWKTPTNVYRPPVDKPFFSSPPVNKPYEFINNEPALSISAPVITNTIKQIGEKGPIHTIPAPNLSLADKPAVIREEPPKNAYHFKEHEYSINSIQAIPNQIPQALPLIQHQIQQTPQYPAVNFHQYQVNEFQGEQNNNGVQFGAQQSYYAPDPDQKQNLNQINTDIGLGNVFPQNFGNAQQSILAAQHNIVSPPGVLSHQELLQIINSIPQQHLVDSYGTPLAQQPQLQQHFVQQAHQSSPVPQVTGLINNQPLFQPEFLNQIHDVPQSVKNNFKPQFHTFNYEEQSRQSPNNNNDFAQSRVTGDYNLEPETSENSPRISIQSPNDALAQTQYVQQYFINNEDNVNENNVESDEQNDKEVTQLLSQLASTGDVTPNMFYSTLPNREAAETLASLQAAGNVNSNLMKISQQNEQTANNNQMRIYVPDDEDAEDMATSGETEENKDEPNLGQNIKIYETTYVKQNLDNHKSKDSVEYEDYSSQQDESNSSKNVGSQEASFNTRGQVTFGSRIKTKTTNET